MNIKHYRDPTPALPRPEIPLPLWQRIAMGLTLAALLGGLVWVEIARWPK